ncbi:MAG: L,D-transpeptidase [Chloroflexi bacterium]|nr:L,D-transpeptidase [Chloroflexota bacterium]
MVDSLPRLWVPRRRVIQGLAALAASSVLPLRGQARAEGESFKPYWVQNFIDTDLWSGPDEKAVSFGPMAAFSYFKVLQPQQGPRLKVQNPLGGIAYVTAKDVGPSGEPPDWYLAQKDGKGTIPARIVGGANVRSSPGVADGNIVARLGHNDGVGVLGQVKGTDGEVWYRIGAREFVHNSVVRLPSDFPPHPGNLLVVELTEPVIITAYESAKPVYSALSLHGTIGWGTPTGFFTILRRVENETMSSETLGIPRNAPGGYYLKDVLYTQYFTGDGASIHYNYWSSNWGYAGSHGCLGVNYDDAVWFWNWASVGTPMVIRE